MKLSFILTFFAILSASANVNVMSQKVTLNVRDKELREVLSDLRMQTGYMIIYNADRINSEQARVSVNMRDASLAEALDAVLERFPYTYTIEDQSVMIIPRATAQSQANVQQSQRVPIRGRVTDSDNRPLAGVVVTVQGTNTGTVTDANGSFTINAIHQEETVLRFAYLGKNNILVRYVGQTSIDVKMEDTTSKIDEVVVNAGYQTLNRRDMVGSFTTIKAEDILNPAFQTIDQMLQGQVAGLVVVQTSSRVGTSPTLKLRGASTILGNQSPLWVVDGIIQEDPLDIETSSLMVSDLRTIIGSQVSWLNPMDIDNITVLRDASATAVYGSRAANGVIVITTKRGTPGQISVGYSGSVTINTRPNYGMFNYMNSQERVRFSEDAFNVGMSYSQPPIADPYTYEGAMIQFINGAFSAQEFARRRAFLETVNTDWFDLLTRTGVSHNHNVSLRGGTDKITYNTSLGYNNVVGQEIGNDTEIATGNLRLDIRPRKNLMLNIGLSAYSQSTNGFGVGVNPMGYATTTSRSIPAFDESGDPLFYLVRSTYPYNNIEHLGYNFINERDNTGSVNRNLRTVATLNLRWNILDWLSYEVTGGYTYGSTNSESHATERTFYAANQFRGYDFGSVEPGSDLFRAAMLPFGGVLMTTDATQRSYNVQNKMLISRQFDHNHRFNAMVAMELRSSSNLSNLNTVYGYVPDRGEGAVRPTTPEDFVSMTGNSFSGWGILNNLYGGGRTRTKFTSNFLSFFATAAYSLKDRYVFNASIRNDASNRFGQDVNRRIDPTYSFGMSWNVAREPWMDSVNWLDMLALRATYGIQGNAMTRIGPDLTLSQGGVRDTYNQYFSTISNLPNPNLSWEKTHSFNTGLNWRLFSMFDLSFDYYWKRSNVIISQRLALEYGQANMQMNGGRINNNGAEFTVGFTPIRTQDWALNISLNSSKNWNKARKIDDVEYGRASFLSGNATRVVKDGYPLGAFWSYAFAGLNPLTGRAEFYYLDIPEEDRRSDIDPTTFLVYSGTSEPDFTGGMNLSLRYKNLTLSSSFALLMGKRVRLPSPYAGISGGINMPLASQNVSKDLLKRWKQPGDERHTIIPSLASGPMIENNIDLPDGDRGSYIGLWENSDAMVADGSFLRCNMLSLTWRMGRGWCEKLGVRSFSFSANTNNIFVIASSRFNGFDPELGTSVHPKRFTLGINIGF
ncbi:MAG: SusC/RagA family TonB-linked outer membrane protein [Rikenellaceae bacterium]|nr:SusC/RagA family TonB-linked outer membrane protein [Rikenellaceae bacterium]MCL2693125.1 SusC/RagA family TonB-linked outer membrane protein [Rikenellaceae bacterium]